MIRIHCTDRHQGLANVHFSQLGVLRQSITGHVRGPFCLHSRTLPSTIVVKQGTALVVDPCYWTPKLPFLYEAKLEFEAEQGKQLVEFRFGLRWCVTDGCGLRLNGKSFVARCVNDDAKPDLDAYRASSAGLWMTSYCKEICVEASQRGVLVACADPLNEWQTEQIDHFPAVLFARTSHQLSSDVIRLVDNCPEKGTVLIAEEGAFGDETGDVNSPQFVYRQAPTGDVSQLRRGCDELQRDMASIGQFAGYVVSRAASRGGLHREADAVNPNESSP